VRKEGRFFQLDDGSSFFPLGANLSWASHRGTQDYEDWLPKYAAAGANWGRIWLSPNWVTTALERSETPYGRFDLANSWRLDFILLLAEKHGIRLNLAIDSYNLLRDSINWPEWERSSLNKANGGPLEKPGEFWTSQAAQRVYRNKLRYLVARYGASTGVFAWEFWNEVDGVTDYRLEPVKAWHERMSRYLRSIDPFRHLITTSFGGNGSGAGDASVFSLPGMDFSQSHIYEAPDLSAAVADAEERLGRLGKPHFVAEIGADTTGPRAEDDPNGLQIHDPLWTSIAVASAGGAMPWWWDSYIHPRNLYPIWSAASRFIEGIDWGREGLSCVRSSVEYQHPPAVFPLDDIVLERGETNWSEGAHNRPVTIRVSGSGAVGPKVSGMLHGVGNHPTLHNPVTFQTDFDHPVSLVVEVENVSGYGGANLRVTVDEAEVLAKDFPDDDKLTSDLKQYSGEYRVEVPAGKHEVVVANDGQDWFTATLRFEKAVRRTRPPLVSWASAGKSTTVVWVRHRDRTWRQAAVKKVVPPPAPPSILSIQTVPAGTYDVELWDTWKGEVVQRSRTTVDAGGRAAIELPEIAADLAVKLKRRVEEAGATPGS
jgi:hypothetical protein